MASPRAILKRTQSVKNIAKITKTMQMIATAKFKRAHDRAVAARPYTDKLTRLIGKLAEAAGADFAHPLLGFLQRDLAGIDCTAFGHDPRDHPQTRGNPLVDPGGHGALHQCGIHLARPAVQVQPGARVDARQDGRAESRRCGEQQIDIGIALRLA